jgi:hypothetical protein
MEWLNLGKKRTKFGRFLDRNGIEQQDIQEESKVNKNTLSQMCNDDEYTPRRSTGSRVIKALRKLGYETDENDFWV